MPMQPHLEQAIAARALQQQHDQARRSLLLNIQHEACIDGHFQIRAESSDFQCDLRDNFRNQKTIHVAVENGAWATVSSGDMTITTAGLNNILDAIATLAVP